ncbi:MAG: extracellular solute-binding protein [bacterium]
MVQLDENSGDRGPGPQGSHRLSVQPNEPRSWFLSEWVRDNPKYLFLFPLFLACIAPLYFENPYRSEKKVIQAWGMVTKGDAREGYVACRERFEEMHPDNEVLMFSYGRGDNPQRLMSALVGDTAPDVVQFESYQVVDWAARDAFLPLDEFIERDRDKPYGVRREEYISSAWGPVTYMGQTYGIPSWVSSYAMAYNKDAFREAGLDPESPPKTIDELLEFSRRLVRFDEKGNIQRGGWIPFYFLDQKRFATYPLCVWQAGGTLMSPDGLSTRVNSEASRKVIELFKEAQAIHGGWTKIQSLYSLLSDEGFDLFLSGRIAIDLEDDWTVYRAATFAPDFDLGVAPFPSFDGQGVMSHAIGLAYVIPANARNPEAAWEFIKWMNSPEAVMLRNKYWHEFTVRRQGPDKPHYVGLHSNTRCNEAARAEYRFRSPRLQAAAETFRDLLPYTRYITATPASVVFRYEMSNALRRILSGQMSMDDALDRAEKAIDEQLEEFRSEPSGTPLSGWTIARIVIAALLVILVGMGFAIVRKSAGSGAKRRDTIAGYLMASPWIIGFFLFIAGPIIASLILSFCSFDVLHPARFIGLGNYRESLTSDRLFWRTLGNTAFMTLGIPIGMAASLAIALLLNMKVRGLGAYRTIYYLPAIVPMVASAALWQWLFSPQSGPITWAFEHSVTPLCGVFGLQMNAPLWLQDDAWIKPSFILMGLWTAGAGMIIWLAGLQGIPGQLYESASIDGAGPWARFRAITIPMLTPYIFFNLITGVIGTFQIFTKALVMTNDYPSDAILFYVYYLFNNAFRYFHMGYASAMAWILFLIVLILTVCQVRGAKHWVYYGGN